MTDRHEKAANDGGSIKVGDHARIWRRGDTWWINIQVHRRQVRRSLETIIENSLILRQMIEASEIGLVGAMYDIGTGKVTFY